MTKLIGLASSPIVDICIPDNYWVMPSLLVGLEFEIENITKLDYIRGDKGVQGYWSVKEDHSLRNNGWEFICKPVMGQDLTQAIDILLTTLKYYSKDASCSKRTSLHIHADVRHMEHSRLPSILYMGVLLERALFKLFPSRARSQYCVPVYDSAEYTQAIGKLAVATSLSDVQYAIRGLSRYHALNVQSLAKYGTLEFRHAEGTIDKEVVHKWINVVMGIVKAQEIAPDIILQRSKTLGSVKELIRELYGSYSMYLLNLPSIDLCLRRSIMDLRNIADQADPNSFVIPREPPEMSLYTKVRKKKLQSKNKKAGKIPTIRTIIPPPAPRPAQAPGNLGELERMHRRLVDELALQREAGQRGNPFRMPPLPLRPDPGDMIFDEAALEVPAPDQPDES